MISVPTSRSPAAFTTCHFQTHGQGMKLWSRLLWEQQMDTVCHGLRALQQEPSSRCSNITADKHDVHRNALLAPPPPLPTRLPPSFNGPVAGSSPPRTGTHRLVLLPRGIVVHPRIKAVVQMGGGRTTIQSSGCSGLLRLLFYRGTAVKEDIRGEHDNAGS
ncbi:hypothetical protein VTK73DRAFT_2330 [Phialemonium thermophilum]|uniref:Uncharacterized protein n=1 Tax=Phialemonium thermophilum TaxID=223376 RepID=A0ABR3VSB9_9PEZI